MTNTEFKKHCYKLYKNDWVHSHISLDVQQSTYRKYMYEQLNETYAAEKYSFEDYIFDFGYGEGDCYACYEEFLENEFLDEEYMQTLIPKNSTFWEIYQQCINL